MARAFWVLLGANYALAVLSVLTVLRRRREPPAMVAWIIAILTLPGLGMLAYWLLASGRLRRKVRRRRRRLASLVADVRRWGCLPETQPGRPHDPGLPEDLAGIERLGRRLADMPATAGNDVRILEEAEATYAALEEALRAARHYIHLEYYIWQPDETGHHFRDVVIERARAGIECRILLDAVGCRRVRRAFLRPLLEAGVRVGFFMPLRPFVLRRRWSVHLRNHRKIAVVDGRVGFLGSQNIGDEYRGRRRRLSPWYDTHLRVAGSAPLFLQQTFAEDWYLATRERLDAPVYFPSPAPAGPSVVQVLPTGPDQNVDILAQIVFAAVSSAQRSIRIATPYFAPDPAVRMALAHAQYRGVPVRLVLPSRSDSRLAVWAARSFYAELLEAGIEIYEYEGGVLHSKLVTVDDRWCMVGSANMDVRSFRLNFEITALVYDPQVAADLGRSIDRFCAGARRITVRDVYRQPVWRQLGEGAARLFAPLL
jgi:cardiolipin synthase